MPSTLDKVKAAVDTLERQVGGARDRARASARRVRRRASRATSRSERAVDDTADAVERRTDQAADRVNEAEQTASERVERARDRVRRAKSRAESASQAGQRQVDRVREKVREAEAAVERAERAGSDRASRVRERIERVKRAAEQAEDSATGSVQEVRRTAQRAREQAGAVSSELSAASGSAAAATSLGQKPDTGPAQQPEGPITLERSESDSPTERDLTEGTPLDDEEARQLASEVAGQDERIDESDIVGFERVDPQTDRSEALPQDLEPTFRAEISDEARRDIARQQIVEENPEIDEGDIARLEPAGDGEFQAVFTDEARAEFAEEPAEPEGGPLNEDRLLETTSPASKLFGLEDREEAIEAEAQEGSIAGQVFVGGESLEAVGVDASRAADDILPDPDVLGESVEVPFVSLGPRTTVEVNPRLGIGDDTPRAGEQARNAAVGIPAGAGVVAGLGPRAAGDAGLRLEATLDDDVDSEALVSAEDAAEGVGTAGGTVARSAAREPVGAALDLALPFAASKASPVSVSRFEVPTRVESRTPRSRRVGAQAELAARPDTDADISDIDLGTETVVTESTTARGVRVEVPDALQRFTNRNTRGRTVVGASGRRPTVGAPDVDLEAAEFRGLGDSGDSFEPRGAFETDVIEASASRKGGEIADRVESTRGLVEQAESPTGAAERRSVESVEEAVAATEGVPPRDAEAVTEALAEADATIFGSGAVRAQADEFRAPGDLDIVVPDKKTAQRVLDERLADTDVDVGRVFDIKEADDFAGLEEGDIFGFGARSQRPIETDSGVRVNPIGEELQRKAGASGFVRGEGSVTDELDVGPRENPGGQPRTKDVDDAAAIGQLLLGADDPALARFEVAFGRRTPAEDAPATGPVGTDAPAAPGFGPGAVDGRGVALADGGLLSQRGQSSLLDDLDAGTRSSPTPGRSSASPEPSGRSSVPPGGSSPGSVFPSATSSLASPSAGVSPLASVVGSVAASPSPGPSASTTPSPNPSGSPSPGNSPSPSPTASPSPDLSVTVTPDPRTTLVPTDVPVPTRRLPYPDGEPDEREEFIPLFGETQTPFVNPIVSGLEESFDSVLGAGATNTVEDVFADLEGGSNDPLAFDEEVL